MKLGDSVAVNGICLTVVKFDTSNVTFEVSSETMLHSTFAEQKTGAGVNLERALKLSDRLGGHLVQGHVDCVSEVKRIKELGGFYEIDFKLPNESQHYIVSKGSITIDGISLTIADLAGDWFRVAVIPHTYEHTVLKDRGIGDKVHLETDVIARYVERLLLRKQSDNKKPPITKEFLKNHGF
jgi:riboflavin synthase